MGAEHTVELAGRSLSWREGESLLDALDRQKAHIPSSCRAGACHSCLVKAERGTPPGMAQLGLKDTWKKQGLFLACLATDPRPLSLALPDGALSTRARLVHKALLAPDVVRLRFALDTPLAYQAGQFVSLTNDAGVTRSYSIASVPGDPALELHVRRAPSGKMSGYLHDTLTEGDTLTLRGPQGDCFYTDGRPDQPLLLVATGTGLAPMIGIARDALRQAHRGAIWLLHGGRTRADLYLHDTLEELARAHPQVHYLPALSGDEVPEGIFAGRVTDLMAQRFPDLTGFRLYACGSPAMVKDVKQRAYTAGVALEDLLADAFVEGPRPGTLPTTHNAERPRTKRSLPVLSAPKGSKSSDTGLPTRQKWRHAVQALTLSGFLTQGILYYTAQFRPLGGLLPFMAYDSLGHLMVSSALIVWALMFVLAMIFGRFMCGWLCPLGALQDAGERLLRALGFTLPKPKTQPVWARVGTAAIVLSQFVVLPLLASPVRMWQLDLHYKEPWLLGFPFHTAVFLLDLALVFVVIGLVLPLSMGPRTYCKLVCETGLLLELSSRFSFGRIRRNHGFDRDTCLSCQRCTQICPQGIKVDEEVHLFDRVVNTSCVGCQQCVSACPNGTIVYSLRKRVIDTGRAAAYLATVGTQLSDLPRYLLSGVGALSGAWLGFVVLPPSYFHTYLLLASLGGLVGYGAYRLLARGPLGPRLAQLTAEAAPQVERERRARVLPLTLEERREVTSPRTSRVARLGLAACAVGVAGASVFAASAAVPPRIEDVAGIPAGSGVSVAGQPLRLGVPSVQSSELTGQGYMGLPGYLAGRLGRAVRLVSASTYTELAWAVADGRIAAALVPAGAAHAVLARAPGRAACVAQAELDGARTYRGVVVARSDGPRTLAEVAGKRVAFVDLDSLSGYWAPWSLLQQHGITMGALGGSVVAGDHSQALRLLAAGKVDVAVSFDAALASHRARTPTPELRVLGSVDHLPNDVLLVSSALSPSERDALVSALTGVFHDPHATEVQAHLRASAHISGLVPAGPEVLTRVSEWMR
ncbi:MAG: hypothetical protein RL385_1881 [Pseudomonadota bacterium]|jgi:NAD(P)H-flavin reductase/ABC-type phosphate/phosphonate transport system substrate-binding protein/polyferredoxin/ferredoxin